MMRMAMLVIYAESDADDGGNTIQLLGKKASEILSRPNESSND